MAESHRIIIGTDGRLRHVYDDALLPLADLGTADVARASHVEPVGRREGESASAVSWSVDLRPIGGVHAGRFETREAALRFERRFVERWLRCGGKLKGGAA